MIECDNRPLVTFALIAYNQERFVREAVEGAFSQDYTPLEIILSDDCSTDRTFEIMAELANGYKGRHRVVLNRNDSNLGVAEHVNRVIGMASGALVVLCAGDDIPRPTRTSSVVKCFAAAPENVLYIHTGYTAFDSSGIVTHKWLSNHHRQSSIVTNVLRSFPGVNGATGAVSKKVYDIFGPLIPGGMVEDRAFAFRAVLMNGLYFVPDDTVMYRIHSTNLASSNRRAMFDGDSIVSRVVRWNRYMDLLFTQYEHDLATACSKRLVSERDAELIRRSIDLARRKQNVGTELELWVWGRSSRSMPSLCREAIRVGVSKRVIAKKFAKRCVRTLREFR